MSRKTNAGREVIDKVYYNLSEIAITLGVSSMHVARLCDELKIKTVSGSRHPKHRNIRLHDNELWRIYLTVQMRDQGYPKNVIAQTLLGTTRDERDKITAICTSILGKPGPGSGEQVTFNVQVGFRERVPENPASEHGDILRLKSSLGGSGGDQNKSDDSLDSVPAIPGR